MSAPGRDLLRPCVRPAIRPLYSATLLLATPMVVPSSASTRPVSASLTSAPYAAGPGLPREPPSASMMTVPDDSARPTDPLSEVRTRIRLQSSHRITSSSAARPDRGDLGVVEVEVAAGAAPGAQQRGADAALALAEPVVEREQVGRELGGHRAALRRRARPAPGRSRRAGRPARGQLGDLRRRCRRAGRSASRGSRCASSSRSITSISSSSSEVMRRSRETISCCIRWMSLGLLISPWSIRCWSRSRRALTCSTSASTLACSTASGRPPRSARPGPGRRSAPGLGELGEPRVSGSERRWWRSWSARESRSWRSSSRHLGGRVGLHTCSSGSPGRSGAVTRGPATRRYRACSPGSPPYRPVPHRAAPPAPGSQVHSAAQWLHVEQRRPALLEELAGHVVAQVAGDVDVGAAAPAPRSSRKSPAPPHTATRRTTRSGSPPTRTPRAVGGSAAATVAAYPPSVVSSTSPTRPAPVRAGARRPPARSRRTRPPRRSAPPASRGRRRRRRARGSTASIRSSSADLQPTDARRPSGGRPPVAGTVPPRRRCTRPLS